MAEDAAELLTPGKPGAVSFFQLQNISPSHFLPGQTGATGIFVSGLRRMDTQSYYFGRHPRRGEDIRCAFGGGC